MSDLFKKYFKEIEFCTFCPKMCRFSCPVANVTGNETYMPWGRQTLLHMVREGHMPFNREVAYSMYQCAHCLLCREYCDHLIEVPPVMIAAREKAVEERIAPHEVIEFRNFFAEQGNPYGDNLRARIRTLIPEVYFAKNSQVVYFAGCSNPYHFPQVIQDTFRVLEAMGIDYVSCYEGEAMCCGASLRELGLAKPHHENAEKLALALSGYKIIVSGSPQCVHELKTVYPELGFKLSPRIFHISEFLWPLIKEGRLTVKRPFGQKVMYHDSCMLGRYLGVYEEPRQILQEVTRQPVIEFSRNRRHAECCGGVGGLSITNADVSLEMARRRLIEYNEGEKKILVTASPNCHRQFQLADNRAEVMDLVSVVARCI